MDVLTQAEAWAVYDSLFESEIASAGFLLEPDGFDHLFRSRTSRSEISTKQWADGYLEAFSMAANIPLVTFDRALAGKVAGSVLLG